MTRAVDRELRILEILSAVNGGAELVSAILPHSSYGSETNIRRVCAVMVKDGLLTAILKIARRHPRALSPWSHGPRAYHFALTDRGREKLAQLQADTERAARIRA